MYIVHLTTELNPIAKVGGLADVVYGLSKALVREGHRVEILLPKYDLIDLSLLKNVKTEARNVVTLEGEVAVSNTLFKAEMESLTLTLFEPHHPKGYFSRGRIYGCPDDNERFIYFSLAAMDYLQQHSRSPDVLHLHDWPTAIAAPLYKEIYQKGGGKAKVVLTIHNLEYQGKCSAANLNATPLKAEEYLLPEKLQDPLAKEGANLLKGGIIYADAVTTVSPGYMKEISTPPGGCHLDEVLNRHRVKLRGILNGIDEDFWNPATDPYLKNNFETHGEMGAEQVDQILMAKQKNRAHVYEITGMPLEAKTPLLIAITRLVPQKGPELLRHAILRTLDKGGGFILLGSASDEEVYARFRAVQRSHPRGENLHLCFEKNEELAHLLFAAADMIIIPSLFEPCGLTQMMAMRYGTIPLVRATGGLADTVFDYETASCSMEERNGFTFEYPDATGVDWALDRAFRLWREDQKSWRVLMKQAMRHDFSWNHAVSDYLALYLSEVIGSAS